MTVETQWCPSPATTKLWILKAEGEEGWGRSPWSSKRKYREQDCCGKAKFVNLWEYQPLFGAILQ
jgi:hypothetical protein